MSSDSKATAVDAASANRLKLEDDDLENDTPIGTTTAGGAPSSTTTSSDVAHRKSKPGINRKKGLSAGKDDGGAESIANGGSSGSTNGSGKPRKRSAANNSDELNGHEEVEDGQGGSALAAAPPTSSSPPPAPASSSSNGKVLKRRKVNHGLSTVAPVCVLQGFGGKLRIKIIYLLFFNKKQKLFCFLFLLQLFYKFSFPPGLEGICKNRMTRSSSPWGLNLPNRPSAFLRARAGRNEIRHLKGLYHTALGQPR